MALDIGSQVAGYRIDALIGHGGGGVVYRATHQHLDRTCALKLLAPQLADDPDFRRRFEREARMAAALDHPHIVPVYDAGEADGVLYLAMRLVNGPDLATVIKNTNGRLDPRRICAILSQVASALDAAHAKGLVHRDVTPGNILIEHVGDADRTEHAYLSDFGLTRLYEGPPLSGTMLAGTPSYMALERLLGVPSAPAMDVYALGCVAYACLIGSPPFPGSSFESVMAAQQDREPPRISDHRTDLPAGVDAILAKAIAREPADRYSSCAAFTDALHDEIHAAPVEPRTTWPPAPPSSGIEQPPARPTVRTTRRRKIIGVAAVAVLLISGLVAFETLRMDLPSGGNERSPTEDAADRLIEKVDAFAIDPAGGVYLSTLGKNHRILKIEPSGTINTIAGTGPNGYSGDNGPATQAQLWNPQGIARDSRGNLYVADTYNHRVRRIDPSGMITTIAGNGTQDSSGDNGSAASAQLRFPVDITIDRGDNLYVAEAEGRRVRRIDQNGQISTVAGTGVEGYSGDGGPATQAQLGFPLAIAVDNSSNLYIADATNGRIRKVDMAGIITSIAGTGVEGFAGDGGPAAVAELRLPEGVAVDRNGNVYIADTGNDRIRKVDTNGVISTVTGSGIRGFSGDGGLAATAQLAQPRGIAVDRDGNLYIGDQGNNRVRRVDPNGVITTLAGAGPGYPEDGGPATEAVLQFPKFVQVDQLGRLYIADSSNHRVRRVDQNGDITTIAGNGVGGFSGDGGPATAAQLNQTFGLALDSIGNVYIADTFNHLVRKVSTDGKITTIAGIGRGEFSGDGGPATAADLRFPIGLAVDGDGSIYIAEGGNDRIRRVDPSGVITTVAGNGTRGFSGDGGPATQAQLSAPAQIHLDPQSGLYVADRGNNRIRLVDRSGVITTVAGNGMEGFSGDGGPAREAQLAFPWGVVSDGTGNLYIADTLNGRLRGIDATGTITTIAGISVTGLSGEAEPATQAQLNGPVAVSIGPDGAVYIADSDNHLIRKIDPAGIITTVAGPPIKK